MGCTFPRNRRTASTIRHVFANHPPLLLFRSARGDWKLHYSVSLHITAEGMKRALSSHDFFKMHQCIQEKVFLCGFTKMHWCTRGKVLWGFLHYAPVHIRKGLAVWFLHNPQVHRKAVFQILPQWICVTSPGRVT